MGARSQAQPTKIFHLLKIICNIVIVYNLIDMFLLSSFQVRVSSKLVTFFKFHPLPEVSVYFCLEGIAGTYSFVSFKIMKTKWV